MPWIHFKRKRDSLKVEAGALLMESLLKAGLPVASSCHGDAVCGRCKVEVLEGWENLSPMGPAEEIVSNRLKIKKPYRVSCQVRILGDITIDTSYW